MLTPPGSFLPLDRPIDNRHLYANHIPSRTIVCSALGAGRQIQTGVRLNRSERALGLGGAIVCWSPTTRNERSVACVGGKKKSRERCARDSTVS